MIGIQELWKRGSVTLLTGAVVVGSLTGVIGCADDNEEAPRSVTSLVAINNNEPLQADLYNLGANKTDPIDDFVPEDLIRLDVTSRPSDPALTLDPNRAFGTVRFTRYTIDFAQNDLNGNGTDDVHDLVDYPMNLVVPIGQIGTGYVLAFPSGWKTEGDLLEIQGTLTTYFTTATITLHGEEETSHDPVELHGGFVVGVGDYADKS